VFGRSWSNSLLRGKASGLYIKLSSSKPLPLRLLGLALLVLQRLSIWLSLVVVGVLNGVAAVVLVGLEPQQVLLSRRALITQLPLAAVEMAQLLALVLLDQIQYFQR
jgi:hypothetical protein